MTCAMKLALALTGLGCALSLACDLGRVDQGRAVAYDKETGVITVVQEACGTAAPGCAGTAPQYALPAVQIKVPRNPNEMGPAPETGRLLLLDTQQRQAVLFDPASASLRTVAYRPLHDESGVFGDDPRVAKTAFPAIDREKKTITLYFVHERRLITFTVADDLLALPDAAWKTGDEVRYYYKQPGQALRLMNVTKTDVRKGG